MSTWRRLRKIGRHLDSEVGILLDKCLEQEFRGIVLAPPFSKRSATTEELRALLLPYGGIPAFHVLQIPDTGATTVVDALDWVAASRMTATPDTLAGEGPETLDGLPFIEIIGLKPIDVPFEVQWLALAAERWRLKSDPAVYLVIPGSLILHPWDGVIEVVQPVDSAIA